MKKYKIKFRWHRWTPGLFFDYMHTRYNNLAEAQTRLKELRAENDSAHYEFKLVEVLK